jgi:sirohydrochlorin cobaltochelatase
VDSALILFAHGSRDPRWREPFEALQTKVALHRDCVLAYLELCEPNLEAAAKILIAKGALKITVVPLFLGAGAHVRKDLPELLIALRQQFTGVQFDAADFAGNDLMVQEMLAQYCLSL